MMKKQILLLMMVGLFFACSNDDVQPQTIEMRVNHFQNTGIAESPVLTLLIQQGDDIGTDNWTKFYSTIEGFNYEPGIIYNLSIKSESIDNPPADGSSKKYTLLKVESTQEVDDETHFDIDLKVNRTSFVTTDAGLKLLNQINIDCEKLCDDLEIMLQNEDVVIGTFKWGNDNELQLMGFI